MAVVRTYIWHGARHILTGYDHLLFLGALVLAATTLWDLVAVVTAFTVAHSLTLTLAALQIVRLPERLVEPVIAASIVCVGLQNIFWPRQARGYTRLAVAFVFGLFHGLGFAGGLLDVMHQMPSGHNRAGDPGLQHRCRSREPGRPAADLRADEGRTPCTRRQRRVAM